MEGKITWQKAWDIDDLCSNFQLSFLSNVYLGQLHSPISLLSLGNRDSASHIFMRPSTSLHWTNSYFLQETCCLDEHVSSERKATSVPGKSPASSTPLLTRSLKEWPMSFPPCQWDLQVLGLALFTYRKPTKLFVSAACSFCSWLLTQLHELVTYF